MPIGTLIDAPDGVRPDLPAHRIAPLCLRSRPTRVGRLQQFTATQRAAMLRYTSLRPSVQRCTYWCGLLNDV